MSLQVSPRPFERPLEYFEFLEGVFAQTAAATPSLERYYRIGPEVLQLSFAGPALLEKLGRPLEHLRIEAPAAPGFHIRLWDSASTGVKMPPPPWGLDQYRAKGEIQGYNDEDLFAAFQHGPDALSLWNRPAQRGLYWVRSVEQIPYYECSAPLRTLFHIWALGRGLQLAHAAAVGTERGAALIVGRGGLGKSTTAVGCLLAGLGYAGDDYVLLDPQPVPTVHSLFSSAKLGADSLGFFPELEPEAAFRPSTPEGKFVFYFWPKRREQIRLQMPLKAILIPTLQGPRDGSFERISPVECLKALAPSTLAQMPGADPILFQKLSGYARQLPAFSFHLPPAPQVPLAVRAFLERC